MIKKALICTSSLFFYPWILLIAGIIVPQALSALLAVLPVLLGSVSLTGATLLLTHAAGKRHLPGIPLILAIGAIVATSFLSIPLGIKPLIGSSGPLSAVWTVSFLLLAPFSSLFFLSLPKNTGVRGTASSLSAIVSLFALLIILLIGPGLISGHSVIHLLALLWLYGVIGLPIIGILYVIVALYGREEGTSSGDV